MGSNIISIQITAIFYKVPNNGTRINRQNKLITIKKSLNKQHRKRLETIKRNAKQIKNQGALGYTSPGVENNHFNGGGAFFSNKEGKGGSVQGQGWEMHWGY